MTEIIKTQIAGGGVGGGGKLVFIPVQTLPDPASAKQGAIYLVPIAGAKAGNLFDEYAVVDGKWELLGQAKIDLSAYAKKTEVEAVRTTLRSRVDDLLTKYEDLEKRVKALEAGGGVKAEYDEAGKAINIMSGATYDEANKAIILDGGAYDEETKTITL